MRGAVEGLASPFPMGERLPAAFGDDGLAQALTGAFDELLAPAISTLDNLPAYLDPYLTPVDVLAWLGRCVGADLDSAWSLTERRDVVAGAVVGHRRRGTPGALADGLRRVAGVDVHVAEGGGSRVSQTAGGALPGSGSATVTITVRLQPGATGVRAVLDRVRAAARPLVPAHLAVEVRVADPADQPVRHEPVPDQPVPDQPIPHQPAPETGEGGDA